MAFTIFKYIADDSPALCYALHTVVMVQAIFLADAGCRIHVSACLHFLMCCFHFQNSVLPVLCHVAEVEFSLLATKRYAALESVRSEDFTFPQNEYGLLNF